MVIHGEKNIYIYMYIYINKHKLTIRKCLDPQKMPSKFAMSGLGLGSLFPSNLSPQRMPVLSETPEDEVDTMEDHPM